MLITSFPSPEAFADKTPFLERDSDRNVLVLTGLMAAQDTAPPWLLATSEEGEEASTLLSRIHHGWCLGGASVVAGQALASHLYEQDMHSPYLHGAADITDGFMGTWNRLSGQSPPLAYQFYQMALNKGQLITPTTPGGFFDWATEADLPIVARGSVGFYKESLNTDCSLESQAARLRPVVAAQQLCVWRRDGKVVTQMEYMPGAPGQVRMAYLYTPPEQRQHGYAKAIVVGLANALTERNLRLTLFADVNKPHIVNLYAGLGFEKKATIHRYDNL